MRILLAGATGLVGSHVLAQALADNRVTSVVAITRRPIAPAAKLRNVEADFANLPEDGDFWKCDAAITTLGTTQADAGSREKFYAIDHGFNINFARRARDAGVSRFGLNSSLAASPSSPIYYFKVKGEIERDIEALGFESLTIVRPSLLGGERAEQRSGEASGAAVMSALGALLPSWLRVSKVDEVAAALLEGVIAGRPGKHVLFTGG